MLSISLIFIFFFLCACGHRVLHSFPTRRSSDLVSAMTRSPSQRKCSAHACVRGLNSGTSSPESGSVAVCFAHSGGRPRRAGDRKSTRLNSSHRCISYAVFCLKKKKSKISFHSLL